MMNNIKHSGNVKINGAVLKPGRYPVADGESLNDLIKNLVVLLVYHWSCLKIDSIYH